VQGAKKQSEMQPLNLAICHNWKSTSCY